MNSRSDTDPALRAEAQRRYDRPDAWWTADGLSVIVPAEFVRAALAAAEAAPLDAPSGGSPYVTRLTNSFSYHLAPEAAPLDVERLAAAMHAAKTGCNGVFPELWTTHMDQAAVIAREYAALRSPDTETAGDSLNLTVEDMRELGDHP